ncbi:hypothetical protein EVAR_37669_1 [Eumeta japonica]|uniref:Uncharacterized protein n=1 Tax=Eumeta variegata TaxID=151549 RepID=A0A4C1Z1U3_EUMVA|nr:hypothetical protein EVAR_37669_1 [Eumeta japonica]
MAAGAGRRTYYCLMPESLRLGDTTPTHPGGSGSLEVETSSYRTRDSTVRRSQLGNTSNSDSRRRSKALRGRWVSEASVIYPLRIPAGSRASAGRGGLSVRAFIRPSLALSGPTPPVRATTM